MAMAAPLEQQQDDKKTPAVKAKKVITNDDIRSSPFTGFGALFYTNSGSINDCDANCFDQVRLFAQVNADKNSDWRRDVLKELELVRSDVGRQLTLQKKFADKPYANSFATVQGTRMQGGFCVLLQCVAVRPSTMSAPRPE